MSSWADVIERLSGGAAVGRAPRIVRLQARLAAAGVPGAAADSVVRRVQGGEWVRAALQAEGAPDGALDALCGTAVFSVEPTGDGRAATVVSDCDECELGFVRVEDGTPRGNMRRCKCHSVKRQAHAIQAAGLPYDLVEAVRTTEWLAEHGEDGCRSGGLVDVGRRDEVRAARRHARAAMAKLTKAIASSEKVPPTFVLFGPPGTGKSRLLVDVGLRLASRLSATDREPVQFATWVELTDAADKSKKKRRALDDFMSARVLLVDEAAEDAAPWQAREVRERLKQRHNRGQTTLLASNYIPGHRADDSPERGTWGYLTGASALLDRVQSLPLIGPSFRASQAAAWAGAAQ